MKKSTPLIVLIVSLISVITPAFFDDSNFNVTNKETAIVGELVTIEAEEATSYEWKIIPETNNFKIIEGGKKLIFSATKEGEYLFICAATKNGKTKLITRSLIVGNKVPDNLETEIAKWLPEEYNKEEAIKLASSFDLIASGAKETTNINSFIELTALNNRATLGDSLQTWQPFLEKVAQYCEENYQNKTIFDHVKLWKTIAKVLKK